MNVPQSDRQRLPTLSLSSALPRRFRRQPPTSLTLGRLDAALERLFAQPRGEQSLIGGPAARQPVDGVGKGDPAANTGDGANASHVPPAVVEPGSEGRRPSDTIDSDEDVETSSASLANPDESAASDTATAADDLPEYRDAYSADGDLNTLDADSAERRAFPRRASGSTVSIHRPKDQAVMTGRETSWLHHASRLKGSLLDVSMSGAALRMAEPLDQGEMILLRLSNRRFDVSVDRKATVLRCSPNGDGAWKIVCQYDSKLTFEQVDVLGKGLFNSRLV